MNKPIHFSLDGIPWPSDETKKIWNEQVMPAWNKLKEKDVPMWLVSSQHWATQGWWIEFKQPKLSALDSIIGKYETDE